ncbi:helix-turn-helix transcriptional regulator [Sinanaerobacter sp. ZZT-01]|uniref:helix-turn-helix transcriptional regulator n=1 Tax=Sinanaerobacter sp. ZZT-01 TaxID=3111540 RepID=UPI002D789C66|nr:helix-turn-helix domain-containing protein [Sinanaerobacter sp. ZZT-01]WRR94221.1 helix-turn-helix domain-containing protein [Sinanaerobacter sp. ZZT-01]
MRTKLIQLRGKNSRNLISKRLGISPQMLGAIENGKRNPSLNIILKMSETYDVTCDDIIKILKDNK